MSYPRMLRVRQRFEAPRVTDVAAAVRAELARIGLAEVIRPGESVAVAAGSRGIAKLAIAVRAVVDVVRELGGVPFIVPAMGSHGGATPEGQRAILASLGVTEEAVGAPIHAAMDTVLVGTTEDGVLVHSARVALEADAVMLVNRVKPHTTFDAPIESGLLKMLVIGLGKEAGASACHRAIHRLGFLRVVTSAARVLLPRLRLVAGVALVENAHEATALVEAVRPDHLETRERDLLVRARRWMGRLPVDVVDLLIVDEMGKNVSGSGMDTNVIGRKPEGGADGAPRVKRVFVRGLTADTHGNAYGVGFADFTTDRLVDAMDYRTTAINCLAAAHPEAGVVPLHFATDREAIDAALATAGVEDPSTARVVRIASTLRLEDVQVSEACVGALAGREDVAVVERPRALVFDAAGNLAPF